GPLVAPSANIEGKPPAWTIKEAKKYFGDKADFYVDGGTIKKSPSMLIKIEDGTAVRLR
ncbi:MAG: Sua5/YciO/YrdC/YwlC family protein, partial [Patescibacteria group bacterium]